MTSSSRYARVSRRAVLQGLSATALLGLAGCATSDAEVLAPSAEASTPAASSTPSASVAATAGQMAVSFTYAADTSGSDSQGPGGGMVRNPYIAVWVEDTEGNLVRTISLWHLQNGQDRWLSDLHRWYAAADGVDTNSGATRAAGSYTVAWDLTDSDGQEVSKGSYVLCIEATREHGPYSLVTEEITIKGKSLQQDVDGSGELSGISLDYTPA